MGITADMRIYYMIDIRICHRMELYMDHKIKGDVF